MTKVLLFHHAQGLTPGVRAFADEARAAGHTVHTPDLFDGGPFGSIDEGLAYAREIGFEEILDRRVRVADDLPGELVYAGFSLGEWRRPDRLSETASRTIEGAAEIGVAAITWWELAWLVERDRLSPLVPVRAWIADLARDVHTLPLTPAIALSAATIPAPFARDPADSLIYATAVENGWRLVTKDRRFHDQDPAGAIVTW